MLLLILQMPELSPQIRLTQVLQRVITGSEQEITCETILAENVVRHIIPVLMQIILSLVETIAQTLFLKLLIMQGSAGKIIGNHIQLHGLIQVGVLLFTDW